MGSLTAVLRMAATSEPAYGSVMARQMNLSPLRHGLQTCITRAAVCESAT